MKNYCILGNDNRSNKLKELYNNIEENITNLEEADIVIAPIPFSRDDIILNGTDIKIEELIEQLSNNKILFSGAISTNIKEQLKR